MSRVTRTTVCEGAPIFALTADTRSQVWLATGEGLFYSDGGGWQRAPHDLPHLNTALVADDFLFAAGPGGMARSIDNGRSWQLCWLDQIESAVTCLAASPNFSRDRALLAGTGGDGILRSTDGGRHWELSNFGLREFAVLALVVAPRWERREVAFAATEGGLYRSPNGGRAWKRIGAGPKGVTQCLAVSHQFASDATVFAGTESNGLYKSTDGGQQWKRVRGAAKTINGLLRGPDGLWVGTNAGVAHLADGGQTWETIETRAPVLCLAKRDDKVYAGTSDGTLLRIDP
jgi:photosystem II stability/assembly factor-like uncharacterized protein